MVKIYSLRDPVTDEIRYIGQTRQTLEKRLFDHTTLSALKKQTNYKNNWIKSLRKQGFLPIIEVLDEVEEKNASFWENFYIDLFFTWGFKLTNLSRTEYYLRVTNEKRKSPCTKKVYVYDGTSFKFSKEYDCVVEASKQLNISSNRICSNITKKQKTSKKYYFSYKKVDSFLEILNRNLKVIYCFNKQGVLIKEYKNIFLLLQDLKLIKNRVYVGIRRKTAVKQYYFSYKKDGNVFKTRFIKINQYDLDDNFLKSWDSIKEAAINLKLDSRRISDNINGKRKNVKNFKFKKI